MNKYKYKCSTCGAMADKHGNSDLPGTHAFSWATSLAMELDERANRFVKDLPYSGRLNSLKDMIFAWVAVIAFVLLVFALVF